MTEPLGSQDKFYALLDKYSGGIEPLESWESLDLAELETLVNTELQERVRGRELESIADGEFFEIV